MYYKEDLVDLHRQLELTAPKDRGPLLDVSDAEVREILSDAAPIPLLAHFKRRVEKVAQGQALSSYEKGRVEINRAFELFPNNPQKAQRILQKAWRFFREAAEMGSPDASLYLGAHAPRFAKDPVSYFDRALDKRGAIASMALGKIWADRGLKHLNPESALQLVDRAIAEFQAASEVAQREHPPVYGEVQFCLAQTLSNLKFLVDGKETRDYESVLHHAQLGARAGFIPAYQLWAEMLFESQGDPSSALAVLEEGLSVSTSMHTTLGTFHLRGGALPSAIKHLNEAVRLGWLEAAQMDKLIASRSSTPVLEE